jgi:hypothetical protein
VTPPTGTRKEKEMGQILIWIVVIVVFALLAASWEEQQKRRQKIEDLQRAKAEFLKALSQGNICNLMAYGSFSATPAEIFESAEESGTDKLEAEPTWREMEKWRVLNFGGLVSSALLDLGSVTLVYGADGSIAVQDAKSPPNPYDVSRPQVPEPFTPQDFRLSRPSPDTATLSYKVTSGVQIPQCQ